MEENNFMRYCEICAKNKNDSFGMRYHIPGYINTSIFILQNNKCLMGHDTIQLSITCEDYEILTHISTDPNFMYAMINLHDTNIIEYNLKMSQFRQQVQMQQQQQQQSSIPHCPTCGSTNLKKISGLSKAGSVALWGIFAAGRTSKTWHCNNCKAEW